MKKSITKKIVAAVVGTMLFGALAATTAMADGQKVIKISYGLVKESGEGTGAAKFEELIEEKLGDKFDVQCYSDAQLGDDLKSTQAVAMGELECVITSCSPLTGMCSELLVFDLPFLFPNFDAADAVLEGDVCSGIAEKLEGNGLHVLGWMENGYRCLTNSKKDVHVPEDVAGLKIRTMENEMHLALWKELGAVPTPMAFSEVFTALEQGAIDGQENPLQTDIAQKWYEVSNQVVLTGHCIEPMCVAINEDKWQSLDPAYQEILADALKESIDQCNQTNVEAEQGCIDFLREEGLTITEPDLDAFMAYAEDTYLSDESMTASWDMDLYKQIKNMK